MSGVRDLHLGPHLTVHRVHGPHQWVLTAAAVLAAALTVGELGGWLAWDEPITRWVVDARTDALDDLFRSVSYAGSTPVVFTVSLAAAASSWRRCRSLALAVLVVALARPLVEFALKELVQRDRPIGDRLVRGEGYSFPSGHPLATAASWGMLPPVVALYTRRRVLSWAVAIGVWALVVLVGVSRVWLGVHWASDVLAAIALAVLGVGFVERFLLGGHGDCRSPSGPRSAGLGSSCSAGETSPETRASGPAAGAPRVAPGGPQPDQVDA